MDRLRIGASITVIIGAIYAAAGLFNSLQQFGLGIVIAMIGVLVYGYVDYVTSHANEMRARYRAEVWHRRDLEAAARADRVTNRYELPLEQRY
jgi:hypothetical protein